MKLSRIANQAARVLMKIYEEKTGNELDFLVCCKYASVVQCAMDGNLEELDKFMDIRKDEPEALPEDFRRIALLFTSRCTRTKMTAPEKRAWEGAKGMLKGNEFELLEWFYGLDKSPEYDQTWHRKGQPAALLNNLNAQLDLAYAMKEAERKSQPKLGTAPQW